MSQYYENCPIAAANMVSESVATATGDAPILSEFDKHREWLLSDDVEEGWASELRRYLSTVQQDVKKDVDIVEWWQVSNLNNKACYCLIKCSIEPCPALPNTCMYHTWCPSISGIICSLWMDVLGYQTNSDWMTSMPSWETIWRTHHDEICMGPGHLVFGSLVQSSLLAFRPLDQDRDQSSHFPKLQKTGPNWYGPVQSGLMHQSMVTRPV